MSKDRTGLYEGMYILSTTLSDDSRKKALDKITDGIAGQGGNIEKVLDWGRRRLAYAIGQKREGHYYIVYFSAPTRTIQELWKEYHLHEDLIRFATMRVESIPESLEFKSIRMGG